MELDHCTPTCDDGCYMELNSGDETDICCDADGYVTKQRLSDSPIW